MVIFFDIDDTLMNHSVAIRAATMSLYERLEPPVTRETFVANWEDAHRRYYPRYLSEELTYETASRARVREAIGPNLSDHEADGLFRHYLTTYQAGWSLFPDVLPCLDRLSSFRLGVVSNGRSQEQRRKLAATNIRERFAHVLISEDCGYSKPHPEIFRRACDAFSVPPAEAVYVGNEYEVDACGARRAGLRGMWLDRKGAASSNDQGPVIGSLNELFEILEVEPSGA